MRRPVPVNAASVADGYITRGGADPMRPISAAAEDIVDLASFILWHDPADLIGGVRRDRAFEAMCRLLNLEQHVIRNIVGGE